ncbi:Rft-1-domain-containing protein [Astrocystis sublimbata]|nr:Rft-1-domain-containing protein [Astrocystis sublimbata]
MADDAPGSVQRSAPTPTSNTQAKPEKTGSAVKAASLLIILQIASRAITFGANQLLLRFLTAQLLGVSAQLEVYYLSVLFFARESLRVAVQRYGSGKDEVATSSGSKDGKPQKQAADVTGSQSVVNIAHLSLGLGLASSLGLGWAYLRYVDTATASTPYLGPSLRVYGFAALIELLSEPAFVVLQHRLRFGPRAVAESTATVLRCVGTFGAANWGWRQGLDLGVVPFAFGQLAYSAGLLAVYTWYGLRLARSEGFSLFPRRVAYDAPSSKVKEMKDSANESYALGFFYQPTLQLAYSLMSQSLVKHVLTQGDTFLVSILSDPQSQGVYALANNYGSLLARLVFQPIEESSRNYFSKLLSSTSSSSPPSTPGEKGGKGDQEKNTAKTQIRQARSDFQALLRLYLIMSVVVVSIGPYAAPLLVQIVAGPRWSGSGAGAALAKYCLYIPLLAVNGVTEAFISSVATKSEVHRQSFWMGLFSLAFAVAGFVSLRVLDLGAAGLVYANAINMLCRITWSGAFISLYFRRHGVEMGWRQLIPNGSALYVVATAVQWGVLSRAGIAVGAISSHVFKDLITVGALALPYVGLIAYAERRYLMESYRSLRGRRGTS